MCMCMRVRACKHVGALHACVHVYVWETQLDCHTVSVSVSVCGAGRSIIYDGARVSEEGRGRDGRQESRVGTRANVHVAVADCQLKKV